MYSELPDIVVLHLLNILTLDKSICTVIVHDMYFGTFLYLLSLINT